MAPITLDATLSCNANASSRPPSKRRAQRCAPVEDAFHVVIPALPGYGFSSRPTEAGWGVERIGRAWDMLMKRLGYTSDVAQGGDWGAGVVEAMGRQAPVGLLGLHTNLPAVFPPDVAEAITTGAPAPAGLSPNERAEFDAMRRAMTSFAPLSGN